MSSTPSLTFQEPRPALQSLPPLSLQLHLTHRLLPHAHARSKTPPPRPSIPVSPSRGSQPHSSRTRRDGTPEAVGVSVVSNPCLLPQWCPTYQQSRRLRASNEIDACPADAEGAIARGMRICRWRTGTPNPISSLPWSVGGSTGA